jgi:hypothetical protein
MTNRKLAIAFLAVLALASFAAAQKSEQEVGASCPVTTYGELPATVVNTNRRMKINVTYFEADDPNAFISEKAGLSKSPTYLRMKSEEVTSKLDRLERQGMARFKGEGSTTPYFGEVAEFELFSNEQGSGVEASHGRSQSTASARFLRMRRLTEAKIVGVSKGVSTFYRVALISSLISVNGTSVVKNVDLDASVLLVPGQTALFKLASDGEQERSRGRSYMAVTVEPVQ